jgi:predicted phosphodiesterase
MRQLPFDLRFMVGTDAVHLVHGSPRKVNEYLFEDKPARLYERLAAAEESDVLTFGHTHKPWVREYGGVLFVNCGSVGKPKDGDPRGAFAILEAEDGGIRVHIERVEYDAAGVAREVAAAGLPSEFADKLLIAA